MAMGAMDTHKYYGGSGSFADRRKTWEDLGLGSAAEYQGTATQNARLVSAMNANKGLKLASQSASPAETPAANTAAAASSSSSAQPTVASYASQSQQIADQLKQLYQQPFEYDAASDPVYQQLLQRREALGEYKGDPAAIYEQYLAQKNAMGPFKYDYASDPVYQQYARQYTNAGKRAMDDTLAQVSARTGGLASSYAGGAAQQAYNKYMTDLDNIVPQLEQIAYNRYRDQQSDLASDYSARLQQEALGWDRYRTERDDIDSDASLLYQLGNNAYSRNRDTIGDMQNLYSLAQNAEQTEYKYLADLIENSGYEPTDAELQRAGMDRARANAYKNIYNLAQEAATAKAKSSGGSGSGGSGGSSSKKNETSSVSYSKAEKALEKEIYSADYNLDKVNDVVSLAKKIKNMLDQYDDGSEEFLDWMDGYKYGGISLTDWYRRADTRDYQTAMRGGQTVYRTPDGKWLEP